MAPRALLHFSEDPTLTRFEARPSPSVPDLAPAVWAIDDEHQVHYWFPRQCPRIVYWADQETTPADAERFL